MTSSPFERGVKGVCPACGEGRLFSGFLKFARGCEACGQSFESEDAGDGPAVFVILIIGIFIIPLALAFQLATNAPTWLTLIIWAPIVILACLGLLRLMRGVMFNLQFKHKAKEVIMSDIQNSDNINHSDLPPDGP